MNVVTLLVALYALVVGLWVVRRVGVGVLQKKLTFLTPAYGSFVPEGPRPLVSVLIPAKDEAHCIGPCLESVLAQSYSNLEVIVIDDRSEDGTAEVVERRVERDARVRLLKIERLPLGWTGKTHALVQAVGKVRGQWLWFLDADTQHRPEALSVLLEYARREGEVDMVSSILGMRNESFWESVGQPLCGIVLMGMLNLLRANRQGVTSGGFANGQSILVRRTAYEAVGGHEAVKDQFLEDVQLGRLLKAEGFPIRIVMAAALSTTRMFSSLHQMLRGWSRIYYGAGTPQPAKLVRCLLSVLFSSVSAYAAPPILAACWMLGGGGIALIAASLMSLVHFALVHNTMFHLYGFTNSDRRYLALYLLACLTVVFILARSLRLCYTHRVTWRGTRYRRRYYVDAATRKAAVSSHAELVHH